MHAGREEDFSRELPHLRCACNVHRPCGRVGNSGRDGSKLCIRGGLANSRCRRLEPALFLSPLSVSSSSPPLPTLLAVIKTYSASIYTPVRVHTRGDVQTRTRGKDGGRKFREDDSR